MCIKYKIWTISISFLFFLTRTLFSQLNDLQSFPFILQHWPFMLHSLVYHMVLVRQKCPNYPVALSIFPDIQEFLVENKPSI